MDLLDALAISMLPVSSRQRAAVAFKEVCARATAAVEGAAEPAEVVCDPVVAVLAACGVADEQRDTAAAIARSRADAAIKGATACGITPLTVGDRRYPPLLGCIPDPPPVLWVRGDVAALSTPAVAIVGSRAATPYARDVAHRLGQDLAGRGLTVVSGLARGVDAAGHQGCLAAEGVTIAVLGSGLDRIYPAEHEALAGKILGKGCLVSELAAGAAPLPEHFPLRNRIISGISLAVIVVEASEKSGSLITARFAAEQGRDVMAVPGSVLSGRNRGSHALLKDGAKVVESADDILEGLGWPQAVAAPDTTPKYLISDSLLARMEAGEIYRLDELMELTGVTGTRLLVRLIELELAGLVTNTGNGFSRRLLT